MTQYRGDGLFGCIVSEISVHSWLYLLGMDRSDNAKTMAGLLGAMGLEILATRSD